MKTNEITNSMDIIDSRDIIARIEELEEEKTELENAIEEAQAEMEENSEPGQEEDESYEEALQSAKEALADWNDEYGDELKALKSMRRWKYGEALIRETYFTEYVMDMLSDIGDLPKDIPHYVVIDEEATARNVQMDYSSVDFDGVEYLIRNC